MFKKMGAEGEGDEAKLNFEVTLAPRWIPLHGARATHTLKGCNPTRAEPPAACGPIAA